MTFGWQPIDSAPRDGTTVLVLCLIEVTRTLFIQSASWDTETGALRGDVCDNDITHWAPMPLHLLAGLISATNSPTAADARGQTEPVLP